MSAYRMLRHVPLRSRNSFGVDATAELLFEVASARALPELHALGHLVDDELLVLGSGSNILFAGDPPGPLLSLNSREVRIVEDHDGRVLVRADAGLAWHALVTWTLARSVFGLENLALIPGTVGAAPIQNIGAYGIEAHEVVEAVHVFDRSTGSMATLDHGQCRFGYRDSRFKHEPDRYIVTAVDFRLSRTATPRLDYAGLADELASMRIDRPAPADVARAVCSLRRRKLPDPAVIGNAGSFFKNPILPLDAVQALKREHPTLPVYPGRDDDTGKLSAAWLIDACGWKGHRDGDAGVSREHALVLVNHGQASGAELLALAHRITASVQRRFGVALEPEPRIVGATSG